jgi:predicted transcriptional regulator YdeE
MPKTHIEKSITIAADAEKVKSIITDFNHWKHWSPWLILDPEAQVTVSADSKTQEWEGSRIGSGRMMVVSENDFGVKYDLTFLKPFKSEAKADFLMDIDGDKNTILTWTMDGSLPFFMFWMKNMMERMVGMDYDRGLLMLKDYIEKGRVDAKLEFLGESNYAGCNFVGIKNESTIDNIGDVMKKDFQKLNGFAKENSEIITDEFFTVYHKYDFNKNRVVYTSGVGVKASQENLSSDLFNGSLPANKVQTVRHIGPYELLGNAWSAIMAMDRAKEFTKNKKIHPVEFYRNSPTDTEPKELVSDVCMPVKH